MKRDELIQRLGAALLALDESGLPFEINSPLEYDEDACDTCGDHSAFKGEGDYYFLSEGSCTGGFNAYAPTLLELLEQAVEMSK